MTLKEKFQEEPVVVYQESFKLTNQSSEQCEQIAEDFAIGFAEWLMKTRFKSIENIPVEKLLEIYKKTL